MWTIYYLDDVQYYQSNKMYFKKNSFNIFMCLSVIFFLLGKIVCLTYKSAKIFYSKKYDL